MKVSLASEKVIRSPSGKAITKTHLATKMVKNSRVKAHAFIPGGKLEIINTRYINQLVSSGFWLKSSIKRDALQVVITTLKKVEVLKNCEFFTVIAQQTIQENLGLRVPCQVFDKVWLERKDKSRIGRFVLALYWLVIPIKNLLRKQFKDKALKNLGRWQWEAKTYCTDTNLLIRDFMLLTQSIDLDASLVNAANMACLKHVDGDLVKVDVSSLTEYEYAHRRGLSKQIMTEYELDKDLASLNKVLELTFGYRHNKVVWLGITDGLTKHTINLSSLYALTDTLAIDLVSRAHQKFIKDAIYALPFTPTVNIQLLIEVLTLQLVAQDYTVRLFK
ncbi:MAG: hypothetical protein IBX48_00820 [Thiomicrospira sp.]|uniref:carboxysome shell carbonic anhydrase n=1 Tax=Thiomicrospira sp. TaxID=935 RepID=UPI0019F0FFC0|nr:carboxysome shell carbonic anhydrase [Thiomicrospira sp.]MBE0492861.1 hypothetical protein [Thiomicrospira sp.]